MNGDLRVMAKDLEDGSKAVGLFNTGSNGVATVTVKWSDFEDLRQTTVRDSGAKTSDSSARSLK